MQLRLDAADRLVELVEERRGRRSRRGGGARAVRAPHVPEGMARSLLDDVVRDDARLAWRGGCVALAVVGRRARAARGGVVLRRRPRDDGALAGPLADLRDRRGAHRAARARRHVPDARQPARAAAAADRGAHRASTTASCGARRASALATRRFVAFAGDAVLVAHNARFDISFLDAAVLRLGDRRLAAPVVDTVWLARRAARGPRGAVRARVARAVLRHGHAAVPPRAAGCRGDRGDPAAPDRSRAGARRAHGRAISSSCRRRAAAACTASARSRSARRRCPASTSSATRTGRCSTSAARATSARACARTSARSGSVRRSRRRSRPSSRSSGASLGSELEAALEELRLLRELRPPANARSTRPDRYVYLARARRLRRRDAEADAARAAEEPPPRRARRARARGARARAAARGASAPAAQARARTPTRCATRTRRGCATASPRSRRVAAELERLRAAARDASSACSLPAAEQGFRRAFFVASGRVAATRTIAAGRGARARRRARRGAPRRAVARARGCRRAARRRAVPPPAAARAPRRDLRRAVSPPRCISWRR